VQVEEHGTGLETLTIVNSPSGMVENELVLRSFAMRKLPTMNQDQLEHYKTFLDEPDPVFVLALLCLTVQDIFMWITKRAEWPEEYTELGKEIAHIAESLSPRSSRKE
jgi:succinate dehydrogenase flavin-adding protein (antitoxin of CptAB toxin-antitoxin module)